MKRAPFKCIDCGELCREDVSGYHCLECDTYYPKSWLERNKIPIDEVTIVR